MEFNITGICIPEEHYMVDTSDRIREILEMVNRGKYFTINRPRQYGKTTLNLLARELRKKCLVIDTSFEGIDFFSSQRDFCTHIFEHFANSVEFMDEAFCEKLKEYQKEINNFMSLSTGIKNLIKETGKDIVLMIDEVDKCCNNKVFLQFLGMLRNKYLASAAGKDITFKSVILAGVHDIKNLKLAIRDDNDAKFNSSWNIAVKFNINMNFAAGEIKKMLDEYQADHMLDFDTGIIADGIYKLTNGYPYLVCDICLTIDQDLKKDWTLSGVTNAAKQILKEKSTLFDDVIKNIKNNPEIESIVKGMLFEGITQSYNPDAYEQGIMYGIFIEKEGSLAIHNVLFEMRLYNFLLEQENIRNLAKPIMPYGLSQFIRDGNLDVPLILSKFKEFMEQEYRKQDKKFYEDNGRLLFLSFLKPIINGKGFYFVEPETRENKRMDIVVTYMVKKYIIELKLWRGPRYEQEGLVQLSDYLDIQKEDVGFLLTFGLGKKRESKWMTINGKKIYNVVV